MPKLGPKAVNAAIEKVYDADLRPRGAAPIETFLAFKWLHKQGKAYTIAEVNHFVDDHLVLISEEPLGRLGLAGKAQLWQQADQSGRMTIWNNATRHRSVGLFQPAGVQSIAQGADPFLPNAASIALSLIPAATQNRLLPQDVLATIFLHNHNFATGASWRDVVDEFQAEFGITEGELNTISAPPVLAALPPFEAQAWTPNDLPSNLRPSSTVPTGSGGAGTTASSIPIPLQVNPRIERMVRTAIRSASAVLLVGPPGSGKTALLRAVSEDLRLNDARFAGVNDPLWTTPEESWTIREVVGSMSVTPPNNEIRWVPGVVPKTIAENRWLVLDEINRGDADRIFGGLITWLSDQDVTIGQITEAPGSPEVRLEWSTAQSSSAVDESQLVEASPSWPVTYRAGTSWRLLGTYNGQDAQRVFRFGQALGRRFHQVPVPPMDPDDFGVFVAQLDAAAPLPKDLLTKVSGAYEAHHQDENTRLGPASFFKLREYLLEMLPPSGAPPVAATVSITDLDEFFTEAYLVSLGQRLALMDEEDLEALRSRLVDQQGIVPSGEWAWLTDQLRNYG